MSTISRFELTDKMIESFYREGYFYAPQFITSETVDALNQENTPFANQENNGEWKSQAFTHFDKHAQQFPKTAAFISSPEMVEIFERILGDSVRLWMGMYAVVPPNGNGLEWHQDNMYTHILGHMLNGFIALDHISQKNAGLWIAPRTHLFGRQPNLNEGNGHRRAAEPDNGIPCEEMSPGDAIIFHRELLHHSKQNHTDQPRRAYAFQVASASCRYAKSGQLLEDREWLSK